jgi:hypothetical protein
MKPFRLAMRPRAIWLQDWAVAEEMNKRGTTMQAIARGSLRINTSQLTYIGGTGVE